MFKNKKDGALIALTVIAWVIAVVFACVTDFDAEPTPWTLYLFGVFLVLAIMLTVFAVRAFRKFHPKQNDESRKPEKNITTESAPYLRPSPRFLM